MCGDLEGINHSNAAKADRKANYWSTFHKWTWALQIGVLVALVGLIASIIPTVFSLEPLPPTGGSSDLLDKKRQLFLFLNGAASCILLVLLSVGMSVCGEIVQRTQLHAPTLPDAFARLLAWVPLLAGFFISLILVATGLSFLGQVLLEQARELHPYHPTLKDYKIPPILHVLGQAKDFTLFLIQPSVLFLLSVLTVILLCAVTCWWFWHRGERQGRTAR